MQLWAKDVKVNEAIEQFTTGKDRTLDLLLAKYDVLGSIAHIIMLQSIDLLSENELKLLRTALVHIYFQIEKGDFEIAHDVEDIHSQIEFLLTSKLGDVGKKIHSGRSRNDQVLVDLKLFFRDQIENLVTDIHLLFDLLQAQSEIFKAVLLPGYTHFQVAMPSSFGVWFGAFAEALVDDLNSLSGTYKIVNKNPLGSAAGYGASFPLNRSLTTKLLGFEHLNYNVVFAQLTRGKTDVAIASSLASVAYTLNKLASDAVLYVCQNFDFISFPEELMEGSSIMPHKKNPDVFELIRAKTNKIKALPNDILMLTTNLPSGYHRDLQLLKEFILPAFNELKDCIQMTMIMLASVKVRENIVKEDKYKFMFSVERVNELVLQGLPFRDAYKKVGNEIEEGKFEPNYQINHTHEGSIGNLCNEEIKQLFEEGIKSFDFDTKRDAFDKLIGEFKKI